jgi:hypothetical protein
LHYKQSSFVVDGGYGGLGYGHGNPKYMGTAGGDGGNVYVKLTTEESTSTPLKVYPGIGGGGGENDQGNNMTQGDWGSQHIRYQYLEDSWYYSQLDPKLGDGTTNDAGSAMQFTPNPYKLSDNVNDKFRDLFRIHTTSTSSLIYFCQGGGGGGADDKPYFGEKGQYGGERQKNPGAVGDAATSYYASTGTSYVYGNGGGGAGGYNQNGSGRTQYIQGGDGAPGYCCIRFYN